MLQYKVLPQTTIIISVSYLQFYFSGAMWVFAVRLYSFMSPYSGFDA